MAGLSRAWDAGGHRRLLTVGVAVALMAGGLYITALAVYPRADMLKGFDLGVYRFGGLLVRHHPAQLYTRQLHSGAKFTYAPFAALLFAPLSLLSFDGLMDLVVAAGAAALVSAVWIACREFGLRGEARLGATLLVAGLAFWSQPVQRALFLGQVELVLMGVVVWDLCQPDARRWKGAATGIAAGIKLVPLIFIAYLLITRRLRQGVVAVAAFAATILVGFAVLPGNSVKFWLDGYFLKADRAGFVASANNQSLLATITRFAGSAHAGRPLWIAGGIVVGLLGLAAAALLHRAGRRFEGLAAVALTALLISPISWDAHWVWVGPGLTVLVSSAIVARRRSTRAACACGAAFLAVAFAAWPKFWVKGAGLLFGGLFWYAPSTAYGRGDNPRFVEYHWRGLQVLAGNLYVLIGCGLLLLVLWQAARTLLTARAAGAMFTTGSSLATKHES